jgi:hypothetical protein
LGCWGFMATSKHGGCLKLFHGGGRKGKGGAGHSWWVARCFLIYIFAIGFEFSGTAAVGEGTPFPNDTLLAVAAPSNDLFANAATISGPSGTVSGSTSGTAKETGEPNHGGNPGGHSVWYQWSAPNDGTVTFNTAGSAFDTLLGVYLGNSVNLLGTVAENDDGQGTTTSSVAFEAVAGTTYHVAVDGYNGAQGAFTLNWLYPTVSHAILTVTLTNYTSLIIDSDSSNSDPAYNRDAIGVRSEVRSVNASSAGLYIPYRLSYRLLGPDNQPHPIFGSAGVVNPDYTYDVTVAPWVGANQTITNRNEVAIRPAARLDPNALYAVELRVYRGRTFTGQVLADAPRTYYHFTNLVSGDAAFNAFALLGQPEWGRTSAVQTVTGKRHFSVTAAYGVLRYDDIGAGSSPAPIPIRMTYHLLEAATDQEIPLVVNVTNFVENVYNYSPGSANPITPQIQLSSRALVVEPANGQQLDSVHSLYRLVVTIAHTDLSGQPPEAGNTLTSPDQRLLHFNGNLYFGPIQTTFSSLASDPPLVSVATDFVRSQLTVNNQSGQVTGKSQFTYGDGTALSVLLRSNGNAELTSGNVNLTLNPPGAIDLDTNVNVRFIRGPITLSPSGGMADVSFFLPTGLGYTTDLTSKYLFGTGAFPSVPLNQNLAPAQDQTFTANVWICEETKPVWIEVSAVTWVVGQGTFLMTPTGQVRYVRQDEYQALEAAPIPTEEKVKRSNDSYYRYVTGAAGNLALLGHPIRVTTDSQGAAEMDFRLFFGPGRLVPHMPYASFGTFSSGGQLTISNDLVDVSSSHLDGVTGLSVPYNRDCIMPDCGLPKAGPNTNTLDVGGQLVFTLDGGLAGGGSLSVTSSVAFGYIKSLSRFAHATAPFDSGRFLMAGTFLRGDQMPAALTGGANPSSADPTNGPGVILLTGFQPNDPSAAERPTTPGYSDPYQGGHADYSGLNFRVASSPGFKAESVLGGQPSGPYDLTTRSKYYTRWGGVSGIHEAVSNSFSSLLMIYHYSVNFDNFGLSFLDSQNVDSTTQGYVDLPSPAKIHQDFEELKFNCVGDLTDAKVPASEAGKYKLLNYWNGDFVTLGIKFDRDPAAQCIGGAGFLVLGVKAHATHVSDPLYGFLGFHPNGNLVTAQDADPGKPPDLDSWLKMPEHFDLAGPGNESYAVTPVTDAYFNNWDYYHPANAGGFLNFAATVKVPFFEEIEAHVQTGGKTNQSLLAPAIAVNLMGGWGSPNHGWTRQGQEYFTHTGFDPDNVGYPASGGQFDQTVSSLDQYRNNPANEDFHPRARQEWLDVVPFDYPLTWSPLGRTFRSFQPVVNFDLLVVKADHQLKYLSPNNAELVFGFQSKELPQMNLANMLFKSVDENDGTVSGSAGAFAAGDLTGPYNAIVQGLGALNRSLDDQPRAFFQPLLDNLLSGPISQLYQALHDQFDAANKQWINAPAQPAALIHQYFVAGGGNVGTTFSNRFRLNLLGLSPTAGNLLGSLDQTVTDASNAVVNLRSLFQGTGGDRPNAVKLTKGLVADIQTDNAKLSALAKTALASFTEPKFKKFLEGVSPTLDSMVQGFDGYAQVTGDLRGRLQPGSDWQKELSALFTADAVKDFIQAAENDVQSYVAGLNLKADNPFVHIAPADFQAAIRQRIEDRFFGSQLMVGLQDSFRQRLYDFNSGLRQAADSSFAQLNQILRDTLNEVLADLDNKAFGALGQLADFAATSKVTGYAHINDNALKELRLDANADFKITPASQMSGRLYFLFKEYDSEGSGSTCTPAGGAKVAEVSMGMDDGVMSLFLGDVQASIDTKITFEQVSQTSFPRILPVNLAGKFDIKTKKTKLLGTFQAPSVGLVFSVGAVENYLGGKISGLEFDGYKGSGGIFLGHIACNLDPLKSFDEHVGNNIGNPPFTGLYVYGEAWVPVLNFGCLLRASAGVGAGVFYFVEGPTYGGTMKLGVDGKVLCFLNATGTVKLTGIKNPDGLQLLGTGTLCGEICVLKCFKKCKSVDMTYKNGGFDVHF